METVDIVAVFSLLGLVIVLYNALLFIKNLLYNIVNKCCMYKTVKQEFEIMKGDYTIKFTYKEGVFDIVCVGYDHIQTGSFSAIDLFVKILGLKQKLTFEQMRDRLKMYNLSLIYDKCDVILCFSIGRDITFKIPLKFKYINSAYTKLILNVIDGQISVVSNNTNINSDEVLDTLKKEIIQEVKDLFNIKHNDDIDKSMLDALDVLIVGSLKYKNTATIYVPALLLINKMAYKYGLKVMLEENPWCSYKDPGLGEEYDDDVILMNSRYQYGYTLTFSGRVYKDLSYYACYIKPEKLPAFISQNSGPITKSALDKSGRLMAVSYYYG